MVTPWLSLSLSSLLSARTGSTDRPCGWISMAVGSRLMPMGDMSMPCGEGKGKGERGRGEAGSTRTKNHKGVSRVEMRATERQKLLFFCFFQATARRTWGCTFAPMGPARQGERKGERKRAANEKTGRGLFLQAPTTGPQLPSLSLSLSLSPKKRATRTDVNQGGLEIENLGVNLEAHGLKGVEDGESECGREGMRERERENSALLGKKTDHTPRGCACAHSFLSLSPHLDIDQRGIDGDALRDRLEPAWRNIDKVGHKIQT